MCAYLWCLNMISCTPPLVRSCCCCHRSPHRWRGHISPRMGYSTSGGCSQCTVQYQASPHSGLAKEGRDALAQAVSPQRSNIFCSQQKSTSSMAEEILSQNSGSQAPTAQLPAGQIGNTKVSWHLPGIQLASRKRNIRVCSHGKTWVHFSVVMTCPPWEAEGNINSLDRQKTPISSGLLYNRAVFKWLGIYSFNPLIGTLSTVKKQGKDMGSSTDIAGSHTCFGLHYQKKTNKKTKNVLQGFVQAWYCAQQATWPTWMEKV